MNAGTAPEPKNEHLHNKRFGSFYTPFELAKSIAITSLQSWANESILNLERLKKIRILDPAVGDGVFLRAAADWLLDRRIELGDSDKLETRKEIVSHSLFGVDLQIKAIADCQRSLLDWSRLSKGDEDVTNLVVGNSLMSDCCKISEWMGSFDVVIGNPPYGNILNRSDRDLVAKTLNYDVFSGKSGSWNTAALFIVRAQEFLKRGGHLGFLIPNSIIRVGQFNKTRRFLLDEMHLWSIIDEGRPFSDVTLEMVSIFAKAMSSKGNHTIDIESRRQDIDESNTVHWSSFSRGRVFSLYHDDIYSEILKKGKRGILTASRGRDIPKDHVSPEPTDKYSIPYATSGRSVKRFRLDKKYLIYSDDWYSTDRKLSESYDNQMLISTKNYPYPRCVMKPNGIIHGGGSVRIRIKDEYIPEETIGLILNSELMKYICIRYLTNYSSLTTCLNTGIMEDIPIIAPETNEPYMRIFRILQHLHSQDEPSLEEMQWMSLVERTADALVYSLYFDDSLFEDYLVDDVQEDLMDSRELRAQVDKIHNLKTVRRIKCSPRM